MVLLHGKILRTRHFSKAGPLFADKLRMAVFWGKRADRKPTPIEENEEHRLIEVVQRWNQEYATASDLFANPRTVYGDVRELVKKVTNAQQKYAAARRALEKYRDAHPA